MASLQDIPSAGRVHIGLFGKRNSGKSSLLNMLSGQEEAIVSDQPGTTTDPVKKAMEIPGLGACVLIDTAGFDDEGDLGRSRIEKTRQAAGWAEIALLFCNAETLFSATALSEDVLSEHPLSERSLSERSLSQHSISEDPFSEELAWYRFLKKSGAKVILVVNKADTMTKKESLAVSEYIEKLFQEAPVFISAKEKTGREELLQRMLRALPEGADAHTITGDLVKRGDVVLLVMPQDIQAPKGRLILPQVQTIRELLEKGCIISAVSAEQFPEALRQLSAPPKLIITDSQVFPYVYERKPQESLLTSFSILFAAQKGDIGYYVKSAETIGKLDDRSRILIAECCTHAPMEEDIGRVKLPRMLRQRYGSSMQIDIAGGADFPKDLSDYDLIIQCGGCMFHRKYIMERIRHAASQNVPMTNYGVAIAYLTGILDKVVY